MDSEETLSTKGKIFTAVILLGIIIFIFLLFTAVGTVGAGERGIKTRFNAITGEILNEGLYFKIPLVDGVKKVNIQTQKVEIEADAASKDLQTVIAKIALNINIDASKVADLYQKTGLDYKEKIIVPSLEEAVKSATAGYTADQLITKRAEVNGKIYDDIKAELKPYGINVQQLNIVNFNFSGAFNKAIEEKVTAEQNALAAQNKLKQVQFEAEQKVAEARGKAEALTIESNALRSNPEVLQLRALEKWNGVLPQVTNGGVPFINLNK